MTMSYTTRDRWRAVGRVAVFTGVAALLFGGFYAMQVHVPTVRGGRLLWSADQLRGHQFTDDSRHLIVRPVYQYNEGVRTLDARTGEPADFLSPRHDATVEPMTGGGVAVLDQNASGVWRLRLVGVGGTVQSRGAIPIVLPAEGVTQTPGTLSSLELDDRIAMGDRIVVNEESGTITVETLSFPPATTAETPMHIDRYTIDIDSMEVRDVVTDVYADVNAQPYAVGIGVWGTMPIEERSKAYLRVQGFGVDLYAEDVPRGGDVMVSQAGERIAAVWTVSGQPGGRRSGVSAIARVWQRDADGIVRRVEDIVVQLASSSMSTGHLMSGQLSPDGMMLAISAITRGTPRLLMFEVSGETAASPLE